MARLTMDDLSDHKAAWRRLDAVGLFVQIEALILLLSPALALIVRQQSFDPRPGQIALTFAPIIWRIGVGVSRASRVALTIFALFAALHLLVGIGTGSSVETVGEFLNEWHDSTRADFVYALVIGGVSIYTLLRMFQAVSGPDVMLVPVVLIFPLAALFGAAVGITWLVSGIAHMAKRSWAAKVRQLATVGSFAIVLAALAFVGDIVQARMRR